MIALSRLSTGTMTRRRFAGLLVLTLLLGGGACTLAACGKKGDLEPPPGEPDDFGHQYPDPTQE
jgi:predicted small lipoprotein YifL